MRALLAAFVVAVPGVCLIGCAVTPEPTAEQAPEAPPSAPPKAATAWPEGVEIHRDAGGRVVCPVMDVVIATPEDAVESIDHEGRRYYFCCPMCPGKFRENPALFVPAGGPR